MSRLAPVIEKLQAVTLHVKDVERARNFYGNVLGLNEIEFDAESHSATFEIPGGAPLSVHEMFPGEVGRDPGGVTGLIFKVSDPKRAAQEIKQKGGTVTDEPRPMPWGPTMATIADPDGNEFIISS